MDNKNPKAKGNYYCIILRVIFGSEFVFVG